MSTTAASGTGRPARSGPARRGGAVTRIHADLRERILSGACPPGAELSQVGLASELAVSRTPLREALRRLEAEKLVVTHANRGVSVAPISLRDAEDSYSVRLLVEPALASSGPGRRAGADLGRMRAELARMRAGGVAAGDFHDAHRAFHRELLRGCPDGMRELIDSHATLIDRYQRLHLAEQPVLAEIASTDAQLLRAWAAGDAHRVRAVLEFHLLDMLLGTVAAFGPGHRFHSLPLVLAGLGIQVSAPVRGGPARARWSGAAAAGLGTRRLVVAARRT